MNVYSLNVLLKWHRFVSEIYYKLPKMATLSVNVTLRVITAVLRILQKYWIQCFCLSLAPMLCLTAMIQKRIFIQCSTEYLWLMTAPGVTVGPWLTWLTEHSLNVSGKHSATTHQWLLTTSRYSFIQLIALSELEQCRVTKFAHSNTEFEPVF